MNKAYFFDMDGVLFDSMPNHAIAWEEVMKKYDLPFSARDCYVNEGRTGESVIRESMMKARGRDATPDEIKTIYAEKSAYFTMLEKQDGGTAPILGVKDVFQKERMITAFDVIHGKPDPEPYLKAWERSGLDKEQCCVIENAPLGVRAGKAAGLKVYAVNTGILTPNDLLEAGADKVFNSMRELLEELKVENER